MTEHDLETQHPTEEPTTEDDPSPGEPVADAAHISDETGTRYDSVGQTEATPEDDALFRDDVDQV